jgi:hypothetical protein
VLLMIELRRFEKTLAKIVSENRENSKLLEGPLNSVQIEYLQFIGRSFPPLNKSNKLVR